MRDIPAELLNKLVSQHQTKANASDPRMSVTVARAKTTVMDTTYFTTETIRSKTGLGDISLAGRRQVPYGTPNRIYEIHVDEGLVKTAIREYPDRLKDGWKDQFALGPGSSVAIAFEGNWQRYRKYWRLITSEKPYIFWVDDVGNLWSQLWDEVDTKLLLASGVVKVRAIRAWKNAGYPDKDQGVVVGYIKTDGLVYYRNYSQQSDKTYLWENERQIIEFTNTYVSINMFITNDYRMGFVVERSGGTIEWAITHRNWAGMALEDEKISIKARFNLNLLRVEFHKMYGDDHISVSPIFSTSLKYALTDNAILEAYNEPVSIDGADDWGRILYIEFAKEVLSVSVSDVSISDELGKEYFPTSVEMVNSRKYKFTFVDFNNAGVGVVQVIDYLGIDGVNLIGLKTDSCSKTVSLLNLVPTEIPLPTVLEVFNE